MSSPQAQEHDSPGKPAQALPAPGSTSPANADDDFQARCKAPGVIRCIGWDSPEEFQPGPEDFSDGLHAAADGTYQGTMDTTIKTSGAGSLKFTIRPFTPANAAGFWLTAFNRSFGAHQTFYLQFRQRLSPEMINVNWEALGGSWKQFILYYIPGPACSATNIVMHQRYNNHIPELYTQCGGRGLVTNNGKVPYLLQQGDYNCWYGNYDPRSSNYRPSNCFFYLINKWMTFYLQVQIGDWGQPNSKIQAWVAVDGGPYKQWIKLDKFVLKQEPGHDFNVIQLTPYMTHKDLTKDHPAAYIWYDELIISTQPIPAPRH